MRHDYDLPPEWGAMSDEERSRWFMQERCRRRARKQRTTSSEVIKGELYEFQTHLIENGWIYVQGNR